MQIGNTMCVVDYSKVLEIFSFLKSSSEIKTYNPVTDSTIGKQKKRKSDGEEEKPETEGIWMYFYAIFISKVPWKNDACLLQ